MTEKKNDGELVVVQSEPARLLELAVTQGTDIDTIERLAALYERSQERLAEAALVKSLNEFQGRCPVIFKQNRVDIKTFDGKQGPKYNFASLTDIRMAIRPLLDELGLCISFSVDDSDKHVICTIRHRDGASETSQFPIRLDAKMKVNDSQRMASAVSYAQRYSLCGALSISLTDDDSLAANEPPQHGNPKPDASAPKTQPRAERVTKEQLKTLVDEWNTYNKENPDAFAAWVSAITGVTVEELRKLSSWTPIMLAKCIERTAIERGDTPPDAI